MMAGSPPPPPEGQSGDRWGDPGAPPSTAGAPGQPPPGPGGQPYQTDPAQRPSGSNGLAVGALVCGILALLCGIAGLFLITLPLAFILGIVGVVLGIMGNRRAAGTGVGKGQAIAGIVTGAIGLLAAVAWSVVIGLTFGAVVDEFGDPFQDPEAFQERLEEFEEEQEP